MRNSSSGFSSSREFECPGHVEPLDRRAVVKEHQELDFGGAQIDQRGFEVGFKLNALQLDAVQIHLRDIAGPEARAIDFHFPIPVGQVIRRVLQYRFGLQRLYKSIPQIKHQAALLIEISGFRDGGGFFSLVAPQLALMIPFVQVADAGGLDDTTERAPDSAVLRYLDTIHRQTEVRVGPKISGNFRRLGFIDVEFAGAQSRIALFKLVEKLRPCIGCGGLLRH